MIPRVSHRSLIRIAEHVVQGERDSDEIYPTIFLRFIFHDHKAGRNFFAVDEFLQAWLISEPVLFVSVSVNYRTEWEFINRKPWLLFDNKNLSVLTINRIQVLRDNVLWKGFEPSACKNLQKIPRVYTFNAGSWYFSFHRHYWKTAETIFLYSSLWYYENFENLFLHKKNRGIRRLWDFEIEETTSTFLVLVQNFEKKKSTNHRKFNFLFNPISVNLWSLCTNSCVTHDYMYGERT